MKPLERECDEPGAVQVLCIQCEAPVWIRESQIAWYRSRGWQPPRRCKSCRELRRNAAA